MQINKRQTRQPNTIGKLLERPFTDPQAKSGPVIPNHCGRHVLQGKLKNSEPSVKDNTILDNGINIDDKSKIPVGNRKLIFWWTTVNDQRLKLRVCINDIAVVGLIDTGADMSIITPESWHPKRPLQEADVQLLRIGTLSQVKQS